MRENISHLSIESSSHQREEVEIVKKMQYVVHVYTYQETIPSFVSWTIKKYCLLTSKKIMSSRLSKFQS